MAKKTEKIIIPVEIVQSISQAGTGIQKGLNQLEKLPKEQRGKAYKKLIAQMKESKQALSFLNKSNWNSSNAEKYSQSVDKINSSLKQSKELLRDIEQQIKKIAKDNIDSLLEDKRKSQASFDTQFNKYLNLLDKNASGENSLWTIVNEFFEKKKIKGGSLYEEGFKNLLPEAEELFSLLESKGISGDLRTALRNIIVPATSSSNDIARQERQIKEQEDIYNNPSKQAAIYRDQLERLEEGAEAAQGGLEAFYASLQNTKVDETKNRLKGLITQYLGFQAILEASTNLIHKTVQTYRDLDESYTAIAAVAGKSREEMWAMNQTFNQMAQSLGTTTQNIVNASKLYYQQGRTQNEVLKLVEQTTILATVAELDFTQATDYMTAAINGFNIEAKDAVTITDTWSALAARSAVDVKELAIATSKVASLSSSVGMSMETTSAFLSKMIETTREAPENLGTALKTVIARFSEMKDAASTLSDGTPVNRVEEALQVANVKLRDATGQIRNFDDVILDLSKNWDSLTVNEQRYIATQAAGSRQQSRFIALVSNYARNVQLMDIAQNSAGSSTQQFNTQLTGIQASINRLNSAWEGLYTSLESGPSIISGVIDTLAKLVSTLGDFGLVSTSLVGLVGAFTFSLITNTAVEAISIKMQDGATNATENNTDSIRKNNRARWANILTMIEEGKVMESLKELFKAESLKNIFHSDLMKKAFDGSKIGKFFEKLKTGIGLLTPYALAIAGVALALGLVIRAATKTKRKIKELNSALQETEASIATHRENIRNIQSLTEEYSKLYEAGQDVSQIEDQIIEQFGDKIPVLNSLRGNYEEMTKALEDYVKEEEKAQAIDIAKKIEDQNGLYETEKEDFAGRYKNEEGTRYTVSELKNGKYSIIKAEKNSMPHELGPNLNYEEAQEYLESQGVEIEKNTQYILSQADALVLVKQTLQEISNINPLESYNSTELGIQAGVLKHFQAANPDAEFDGSKFVDSGIQAQYAEIATRVDKIIQTLQEDEAKEFQQFLTGNYKELVKEKRDKYLQMLTDLVQVEFEGDFVDSTGILGQVENDLEEYNKKIDNIRQTIEENLGLTENSSATDIINNMEDSAVAHLNEQYAAMNQNQQSAYKEAFNSLSVLKDEIIEINGTPISVGKALENGSLSNIDQMVELLGALRVGFQNGTIDEEKFRSASEALSQSIDVLQADIGGKAVKAIEAYQAELTRAQDITQKGLSLQEAFDFTVANPDFDMSDFTYDGQVYKLNEEAARRYLEAKRELLQAELAEQKAANTSLLINQNSVLATKLMTAATDSEKVAIIEKRLEEIRAQKAALLNILNTSDIVAASGDKGKANYSLAESLLTAAAAQDALNKAEEGEDYSLEKVKAGISAAKNFINQEQSDFQVLTDKQKETVQGAVEELTKEEAILKEALILHGDALKGVVSDDTLNKAITAPAKEAAAATKQLNDELKKQLELLKEQKSELDERSKTLGGLIKDRLTKELESATKEVTNYYEALQKAFDELIKDHQKKLDDLQKQAEKAKKLMTDDSDDLNKTKDAMIEFYDGQIEVIQSKIDALNKEKKATDDLIKMQEARDKYEQAKQRTRLVLTNGGGWRFKRNLKDLDEAERNLASAEQEKQVSLLEEQKKNLEDIKKQWEEIAKNIGKATSELEEAAAFQNYLKGLNDDQLKNLQNQFSNQVKINNILAEQAKKAQERFDKENDKDSEGTLANQIQKWEEGKQQASDEKEKFENSIDPNKANIEDLKNQFKNDISQNGEASIQEIFAKGQALAEANAEKINSINATLEKLESIMGNIGKTSEEIKQFEELLHQVNSSSLESLLEGGSVFNQLQSGIDNGIALGDKIATLEEFLRQVEEKGNDSSNTGTTANNTGDIRKQIGGGGAGSGKDTLYGTSVATGDATTQIKTKMEWLQAEGIPAIYDRLEALNAGICQVRDSIINKSFTISLTDVSGLATGGLVSNSGLRKMDGTTMHPEMVLNANQSAKLFNWIDDLPNRFNVTSSIPSFSNASGSRNGVPASQAPTFSNCRFDIESNADSIDKLVKDIKQKTPFR